MTPPARVTGVLRRLYPRVQLEYARARQRFVLVVRGKESGRRFTLAVLQTPRGGFLMPTLENVIPRVRDAYVGDLTTDWAKDRFEAELDRPEQEFHARQRAAMRDYTLHEGADRLAHEFRKLPGMLGRG